MLAENLALFLLNIYTFNGYGYKKKPYSTKKMQSNKGTTLSRISTRELLFKASHAPHIPANIYLFKLNKINPRKR